MNLDQLIKLVKLANNNPNDHEANAAARKVCKMIAANNYKFSSTKQPEPAKVGGTYNDIHRSTEPMWRSTPPHRNPTQGSVWEDRFWDEFTRRSRSYERNNRWTREPPKSPPPPPTGRTDSKWTWTEDGEKVRNKTVYEQRLRDCSICDKTKLTADESNPFVCADCKWRKYDESKKK